MEEVGEALAEAVAIEGLPREQGEEQQVAAEMEVQEARLAAAVEAVGLRLEQGAALMAE